MSLVQHLSSVEGTDHDPEADFQYNGPVIARKISYDVLQPPSQPVPVEEQLPATPAYKVSASRRLGHLYDFHMLGGIRYPIWIRSAEADPC